MWFLSAVLYPKVSWPESRDVGEGRSGTSHRQASSRWPTFPGRSAAEWHSPVNLHGRVPVSLSKVATIRCQANEAPAPRVGAIVSLPEFRIKALPEDVYIYVSNELYSDGRLGDRRRRTEGARATEFQWAKPDFVWVLGNKPQTVSAIRTLPECVPIVCAVR